MRVPCLCCLLCVFAVVHHVALSRIYLSKDCSVFVQDSCSSSNHPGDPLCFFRGDLQRRCSGVKVPFHKRIQFLDSELPACHVPLCAQRLRLLGGILFGKRTGIECRSACLFGLLFCSGQFLHQVQSVVRRQVAVIAPLETGNVRWAHEV